MGFFDRLFKKNKEKENTKVAEIAIEEICEENNYEYMGYFDQYNSKETYYLIRVKINGVLSHVAYDKDKKLVDMYQGEVADEDTVKQAIQDRYKIEVKDLNIGYENDLFVYWTKYQNQNHQR